MWFHEHFNLADAPDIVTFSKKMLAGGIFHKSDLAPKAACRIRTVFIFTDSTCGKMGIRVLRSSNMPGIIASY